MIIHKLNKLASVKKYLDFTLNTYLNVIDSFFWTREILSWAFLFQMLQV